MSRRYWIQRRIDELEKQREEVEKDIINNIDKTLEQTEKQTEEISKDLVYDIERKADEAIRKSQEFSDTILYNTDIDVNTVKSNINDIESNIRIDLDDKKHKSFIIKTSITRMLERDLREDERDLEKTEEELRDEIKKNIKKQDSDVSDNVNNIINELINALQGLWSEANKAAAGLGAAFWEFLGNILFGAADLIAKSIIEAMGYDKEKMKTMIKDMFEIRDEILKEQLGIR